MRNHIKIIKYPTKNSFQKLTERVLLNNEGLTTKVQQVITDVKEKGNEAIRRYTKQFDKVAVSEFLVSNQEFVEAHNLVDEALKKAIQLALSNIKKFHNSQGNEEKVIETIQGVNCWRKSVPVEKVGLYIPGGSAPLFSTILMLGVPAQIAGCKEIILCTPPDSHSKINPAILYTASLVGITKIFKVGGAQAIAAMAFGTETIPNVYKIFGPGNQFVTKAKELIQQEGVAIDMPAGPSEVLVIADKTANPEYVAADLLSQAEHGPDSQALLVTTDESLANDVNEALGKQLKELPRKEIAKKAIENSFILVVNSEDDCLEFSNQYAPEHLIIASNNPEKFTDKITNAGSVFLGNFSCESAGDYASGTNHTLPTNGFAKNYSGVSLDSFVKKITFQKITKTGIKNIGNAIELMASAEGLIAHKNAITVRLKDIENV